MAVLLEDREAVRPLLRRDPIRNATVIHRMFHNPDFTLAFADTLPEPKAVLALKPAEGTDEPHQFALHATNPLAALHVLKAVPPGSCIYHVADELAFPALRQVVTVGWWGEAICYAMDRESFRDLQTHEVRPVEPRHAGMIAKIWAPEWPAENYVRSRIESGPTAGVYVDGDLVAWDLTHLETDDVIMMGFLHVLDAHRGKGYAKSAGAAVAKLVLAKGKTPCCHVYVDNAPSIKLTEELGFRRVCLQAWGDGVVRA
ncbi:MAG: GNAT family N-acetyltransferase [Candidatus Thermoplasmatota archaeon]